MNCRRITYVSTLREARRRVRRHALQGRITTCDRVIVTSSFVHYEHLYRNGHRVPLNRLKA